MTDSIPTDFRAALATTQPEIPDATREQVKAAVADALGSGAYDCLCVWGAWNRGTMDQDDFSPIAENDDRVAEIADAAIGALATPTPAEPDWRELCRQLLDISVYLLERDDDRPFEPSENEWIVLAQTALTTTPPTST